MPRDDVMGDLAREDRYGRDELLPPPRNPFAPPEAVAQAVRSGIKAADYYLGAPSRAVRGPDVGNYPPGSEEAEFLRQLHGKQQQDWAQSTALGLVADPIALWGVKPGVPGTTLGAQITRPPRMGDLAEIPQWYHGISVNKLTKPLGEMTAERVVTQPAARKIISPEDLQGKVMIPAYGDRSLAGERLLGVGGQRLEIPTELQGGPGFMARSAPYVWASEKGAITALANRANRLSDQFHGADVVLPYTAQGERAVDFSHHMSDTLAEMVKDAKILNTSKTKASAADFNRAMKAEAKDFEPTPDFPGIKAPNLREYLAESPGAVRNKFAKLMDTANFQRAGFPNVAEARFAVTDPQLLHAPTGASGLSIARLDPSVIGPSAHRTYSTGLGGTELGGFEFSVPADLMWRDIYRNYAKRGLTDQSQMNYAFMRGSPKEAYFQVADDPWVESLMRYQEQQRRGQ